MGGKRGPATVSAVDMSSAGTAIKATATTPVHSPRFTIPIAQDAAVQASQLTKTVRSLEAATLAARADPHSRRITFRKIPLGGGPTNVTLRHGLGQAVEWAVVWWLATDGASACNLQFNQTFTTEDQLVLASFVAGVANIAVWGQQ
jgi:hypothetical protein